MRCASSSFLPSFLPPIVHLQFSTLVPSSLAFLTDSTKRPTDEISPLVVSLPLTVHLTTHTTQPILLACPTPLYSPLPLYSNTLRSICMLRRRSSSRLLWKEAATSCRFCSCTCPYMCDEGPMIGEQGRRRGAGDLGECRHWPLCLTRTCNRSSACSTESFTMKRAICSDGWRWMRSLDLVNEHENKKKQQSNVINAV